MATAGHDWLPLFVRRGRNNGVKAQRYVDGIEIEDAAYFNAVGVHFVEDFLASSIAQCQVGLRDTGAATEAVVSGIEGGAAQLALDATNEAQLAGVDNANIRWVDLAQGPIFEARLQFTVTPGVATVAVWGLCGDHNAAVNTVAESIWFRVDAGLVVTVENDDTAAANETSLVATGVTMGLTTWYTFNIDLREPANCKFYINGVRVAAATTFDMSTVATLVMQPVARIGKEGAVVGLGTMLVDYVKVWQNRE